MIHGAIHDEMVVWSIPSYTLSEKKTICILRLDPEILWHEPTRLRVLGLRASRSAVVSSGLRVARIEASAGFILGV